MLADVPEAIRSASDGVLRALADLRSAVADSQGAHSSVIENQEAVLKHIAALLEDVDRRTRLPQRRMQGLRPELRAAWPAGKRKWR